MDYGLRMYCTDCYENGDRTRVTLVKQKTLRRKGGVIWDPAGSAEYRGEVHAIRMDLICEMGHEFSRVKIKRIGKVVDTQTMQLPYGQDNMMGVEGDD